MPAKSAPALRCTLSIPQSRPCDERAQRHRPASRWRGLCAGHPQLHRHPARTLSSATALPASPALSAWTGAARKAYPRFD